MHQNKNFTRFEEQHQEQRPTRPMPFAFLDGKLFQAVEVTLANGDKITGTLETWDQHVNLVLKNSERGAEKLGDKVFLRGGNVLFVR